MNPRDTAYETVLASRLQSTPQYSRQDSNLRCALCERAAVAAGPREYSFSIFDFRLPWRFPPTQSKFENQKSKIEIKNPGFLKSRRDESNVPEPAYQTGAWPLGYVWVVG